ncbi:DUF6245 family protein [Streptomyces sp. NPDC005373]|uniref:DUF6245 family protein n=1 Tax=Streptomyces sp. NPDC005373 TaxID=3156879 RepID=UPI0033B9B01F
MSRVSRTSVSRETARRTASGTPPPVLVSPCPRRSTAGHSPRERTKFGLHTLLGVIAASQEAVENGDVDTLAAQAGQLQAAREALQDAIGNTGVLLSMLNSVGL